MNKEDLSKLIRIRDTIAEVAGLSVRLAANDQRVRGAVGQYRSYYGLVEPIILRHNEYLLEFQALYKIDQVSYGMVTTALVAFRSFLDGVIKQETFTSQTFINEVKNELFIDDNKPFSAYKTISTIVNKTTSSLKMVDNYIEATSLDFFAGVNTKAEINIISMRLLPNATIFKTALDKFMTEWGGTSLELKTTSYFHDRYIIIDNSEVWHLGPSLNYLGKKPAMISRIQDDEVSKHIISLFDTQWTTATPI